MPLRERELALQYGKPPGEVHDIGGLRPGEAMVERRDPLDVGDAHRRRMPEARLGDVASGRPHLSEDEGSERRVIVEISWRAVSRSFEALRAASGEDVSSSGLAMVAFLNLFPPEASTSAHEVDFLYLGLIGVSVFFLVVIFGPMIWFLVKYRRGSPADRSNPSSGSNLIESGWTLGPIILSLGLFTWGAVVYFHIERRPKNALEIQVVGKQWMWKLQHAEGKREIDELHIPVNRTISLTMTSQDVIHSFFVPAFRVKQDAVPGKYTSEWFKPTRTGEYHLFCAEYCGTQHSGMIGKVVVMEPKAYERWLRSGPPTESIALAGERLFHDRGCSGCHAPNSKFHAPLLEGLYRKPVPLSNGTIVTADDQYLRDSILQPAKQISAGYDNIMPSFSGHLTEEEIMQLIAYLKEIGNQEPASQ